jgi:hypothetical protein
MIHIHNGDVVALLARRAGIPGEHVAYRESLVTGPVVPGEDWVETRARTLSAAYGVDLLRARTDVLEQEQLLDAAPGRAEIVLWFEHDLYCLIHLLHLLQRFESARVSLVWCPDALGEQDERALHLMFDSRAAVTPSMFAAAREAWAAYTSPDPTLLARWLGRDVPEFPFLGQGLTLHASRFPSTFNGLGAIEQRALTHIASGFTDFTSIFEHVNAEVPRYGFGDAEVFRHLRAMAARAVPLITIAGEPPKAICTITPVGMNVVSGEVDDLAINEPDFWLGGVHVTRGHVWRWDGQALRIGG